VEKNVPSVIFWMKARAGWRETIRQENTGADGQPMITEVVYRWSNEPPESSVAALTHEEPVPGGRRDDV
jgi:hypothetical protein